MRAFNAPSRTTATNAAPRKSWQWNSDAAEAEQNRAKEIQAAQRRFRKSAVSV